MMLIAEDMRQVLDPVSILKETLPSVHMLTMPVSSVSVQVGYLRCGKYNVTINKQKDKQAIEYQVSVEHDEKQAEPKFGGNQKMDIEIWSLEYLISSTVISVN